ncbi:hypothetical protein ASB68_10475 [Salmonella enterica]|uniref:Uncharacterized protein n=2 Tax=Salmonella houtenae TaxID=59205 RepID=A0A5Y6MC54_SALHO|nr:hypothetical protein [Salmonella enterica]EBF8286625.1 hypothetical protein [Salmonella enterica subsp. houtenae]EDM5673544.1 hypothetical protein [Salmonella enterica subsp. houtenae serovar Houten]EDS4967328.1 hypothetical protein [Salmonella enterica subsp. enterica serovar O rough]EED2896017.1 hypothetical protein [Salmonella enterica subsp. enterica]
MQFGWIMACRECEEWRIATFLRKWKSQANLPRNVLLFFKRDTNTLISGKKMPGLHQAFQQTGVIAKNQNGMSSSKSIGGSLDGAGADCCGRDCAPPLNWLPPCGC